MVLIILDRVFHFTVVRLQRDMAWINFLSCLKYNFIYQKPLSVGIAGHSIMVAVGAIKEELGML